MRIPIIAAAVLLLIGWPPATLPAQATRGADTAIVHIRREVAAVNAMLPRCSRRTLDLMGESLEGGSLDVYRCGGQIRKLVATYYGETGQVREEWYLSGERPFFVFRVDQRYDRPFGRIVSRPEDRVYLRNGQMIRWIGDDGRPRGTTSPEALGRMEEVGKRVADLLDRARTGRTDRR